MIQYIERGFESCAEIFIGRGYENFAEKIRGLGGHMEKIDAEDERAVRKFKMKVS